MLIFLSVFCISASQIWPILRRSGPLLKDLIFFLLGLPSVGLGKRKNVLMGRTRRKRISFFPLAFPELRISYEKNWKHWGPQDGKKSLVCPVRTTTLRTEGGTKNEETADLSPQDSQWGPKRLGPLGLRTRKWVAFPEHRISYEKNWKHWGPQDGKKSLVCPVRTTTLRTEGGTKNEETADLSPQDSQWGPKRLGPLGLRTRKWGNCPT